MHRVVDDSHAPRRSAGRNNEPQLATPAQGGQVLHVEVSWWKPAMRLLAFAAAVVCSAAWLSDYWLSISTQAGVLAVAVLGLLLIMGLAGQPSLGHVAFYGLGAYISAKATTEWGVPATLAILLGVGASVVVALIVGWPTLRLQGSHLAVATFALGSAFFAFVSTVPFFGAQLGIGSIPRLNFVVWRVDSWTDRHVMVWLVAVVLVGVAGRIGRLRFGRSLATLAFDEELAESVGIRTHHLKILVLAASAAIGSLSGSLFAHTTAYVSPNSFNFQATILMLAILFVGGVRSGWGTLISAVVIVAVPELLLENYQELKPTFFSAALLVVIMLRPEGLASLRLGDLSVFGRGRVEADERGQSD